MNKLVFTIIFGWIVYSTYAQVVVEDGFESGNFSPDWTLITGVAINSGSGAAGSGKFATLSPYTAATGRELGARFDNVATDGAKDFVIEFYFRVKNTTDRQLNFHVSDSSGAVGSGAATINLRYQAGWAAYANSKWNTISGLNSVTPDVWYRLRLTGKGWGTSSASYSIEVSDANGSAYTSVATNLTYFQNGNPRTNTAKFFLFTSVYGNNPGFDVDEVKAVITATLSNETNLIVNISGTYPHLAVFSNDGECGIGAVADWAGKLWFITYPPHAPNGSSDKLWSVDTNLTLKSYAGSVGGTHACRMIHQESAQLIIGPYFIDTSENIRTISPSTMPGRLTGVTRHLNDPINKVYFATMEEGFYEVNVNTLEVVTLYPDTQGTSSTVLPGTHGKGFYSSQGRLIYANNGEPNWSYDNDPGFNGPAGVLAENLTSDFTGGWEIVERKNFCEVTGPGSIYGSVNDDWEPVWTLGWDKRSVILKLLDNGIWYSFRLPKGSYTHDALHGWYTEWPRIREITNGFYLAHMHGLFYNFPGTFRYGQTGGLTPLCTYLKMPVDYCMWNGMLVMGRDDASTTGGNKWAGQSHSAPWFGSIDDLKSWGSPSGFGGFYMDDSVTANTPSEPFLINGFSNRVLHLRVAGETPLSVSVEYDEQGKDEWQQLEKIEIPANGYRWYIIPQINAQWIRIVPLNDASGVTAYLHLFNKARKPEKELFAALADATETNGLSDGIIRPKSGNACWLQFAANIIDEQGVVATRYYEIGGSFTLRATNDVASESNLRTNYPLSQADFTVDSASVIMTSGGQRYRLPKNGKIFDAPFVTGWPRGIREVVTERNLLQVHGTFYELPRSDAGGIRRIRPICSHNKHISDFASWRGLLVMTGVKKSAVADNVHVFKSEDGEAGLWFGNVDDLWKMGAPTGIGGPWNATQVIANEPSDPYLFYGYEKKVMELSHNLSEPVTFTVEVDFAANGVWSEYVKFTVAPGNKLRHIFPDGYSAHWIRLKTDKDAVVTATFYYGEVLPEIGSVTRTRDGVLLTFSGQVGDEYTILASKDIHKPFESWTELTTGKFTENQMQYLDQSPDSSRRFYVTKINR